ncbi:uncharacterized protein LOC135815714 isoform X2 [Sycon ciliatum]|uniref:uncharacterized protein LOC135815714 isoform X2 n=1 Tax=Sycon ciliatum TaxID=27933 RepID=UPI0031F61DBD
MPVRRRQLGESMKKDEAQAPAWDVGRPVSMPSLLGGTTRDHRQQQQQQPGFLLSNLKKTRLFGSSAAFRHSTNLDQRAGQSKGLDSGLSTLVSNGRAGPPVHHQSNQKEHLYKELCAAVTGYNKRHGSQRFLISQPSKDDLIFSGVIAIVWEESKADGNFVHTKSMLINSITTVRSIINQCIGKFHLPGSSLSYGIYESNSHTKSERKLHEEDRPLVLMVYGDSTNQGLTFKLRCDHDETDQEVRLRHRRERQAELDNQRCAIQEKLRGVIPKHGVDDGGLVAMESLLDTSLVHLSSISKQAQSALLGLVRVIVDNSSRSSVNSARRLELWELLRPFATQVVFHVRQLVADTHEIVSQNCSSNTCSLMTTNHLNLMADMAKEVVHACKAVGGCADASTQAPYDKAVASLGQQADIMRLLVRQCRSIVVACCTAAQLLANCPQWPTGKTLLPENLFETPPVVSNSVMYVVAVAYTRLIQASFEQRLDDLADRVADMVQPSQLILEVIHSSEDYALLQTSPLYTRLSKLEELLKGDISRLFKVAKQAADPSAQIGAVSTMLLAACTVLKDCSQLLMAAQCTNILNNTVLTGWQLLRMTWFSRWLQDQQAVSNSDSSSCNMLPVISSHLQTVQHVPGPRSVASSGIGSSTALHSENEHEPVASKPLQTAESSTLPSRRTTPMADTSEADEADDDIGRVHSACQLPPHDASAALPATLSNLVTGREVSRSMNNVAASDGGLTGSLDNLSTLSRECSALDAFRTPQAARHFRPANAAATTGRLSSLHGLSKSRQSIISTGSERSYNRFTSRVSLDWSDVYNSRIKAAASVESLRAYRAPISEAGLSLSRNNLLTSDSEDGGSRHSLARRPVHSRPSSAGRMANSNPTAGTMGKLQKMEHNLTVNKAVGKVLENILFSLRQKASQLEAELNTREDHSELSESHVRTAVRPIMESIELLMDEASSIEMGQSSELTNHFSQLQTLAQVTSRQLNNAVRGRVVNGQEPWLAKVLSLLSQTRTACFEMVSAALKIISAGKEAIEDFRKQNMPGPNQQDEAGSNLKRRQSRLYPAEDREDDELLFEAAQAARSMGKDPRRVRAGSISRLVQRLTYHKVVDTEFAQVFYNTFHLFMTPEQFLEELLARFNTQVPEDVTEKQDYMSNVIIPVQLRVCSALRAWLRYDGASLLRQEDFSRMLTDIDRMFPSAHRHMLALIRKCNAYSSVKSSLTADYSTYSSTRMQVHHLRGGGLGLLSAGEPSRGRQMEESDRDTDVDDYFAHQQAALIDTSAEACARAKHWLEFEPQLKSTKPPEEIARIITQLDWQQFGKVMRKEWFAAARGEDAPNFDNFLNYSAEISNCITSAIAETTDTAYASACLRFFVNISQHLLDLHNYHSLYTFVSALVLKLGQEKVESDMMDSSSGAAALVELVKFCSYANDYAVYREALDANQDKFAIPILGVIVADMQAVEKDQTDTVSPEAAASNSDSDERRPISLVNIRKFRALSTIFQAISHMQSNSAHGIMEQAVSVL